MQFIDLQAQYRAYQSEIDARIQAVLNSSQYIMGPQVKELEEQLRAFTGAGHAIACSSGTDALLLALMARDIQPGDEIITTPFTFFATAEVIAFLKAVPVFVDIDPDTYMIDLKAIKARITSRTRGIMPVSLYGQCPDMDSINALAKEHHLFVLEDAAQSLGAKYKGRYSGALSELSATSFFPSKPLGCYGDGGMVFCSDQAEADRIRELLNHGQSARYVHSSIGINGRLDSIQAAVLLAKLPHFERECDTRFALGQNYNDLLAGSAAVTPPTGTHTTRHVYAQYSIRVNNRNEVIDALTKAGIPTAVHYPIPVHLQQVFQSLGYKAEDFPVAEKTAGQILSLPMHPFLTPEAQEQIAAVIREVAS